MKLTLQSLAKSIAHMAPLLGGALAGSSGSAVGGMIATKFGGDLQQLETLKNLIHADPDAALKLKEIEKDIVAIQNLTAQVSAQAMQSVLIDRNHARQREINLSNTANPRDRTPAILAYLLTLWMALAFATLFFFSLPKNNASVVLGIVSSLTTVWVGAMGYYHGSSLGSGEKDAGLLHHLYYPADTK